MPDVVKVITGNRVIGQLGTTTGQVAAYRYTTPQTDLQTGVWTATKPGSLSAQLDEKMPSDGDGIQAMGWGAAAILQLAPVANPQHWADHQLRYRGQGQFQVMLFCGSTLIAQWSENLSVMTTVIRDLTPEQALWITDYADLRIMLIAGEA